MHRKARNATHKADVKKSTAAPTPANEQVFGEGNYAATGEYNAGLKQHLETHDVEKEAREAEPRTQAEKQDLENAERIGRDRSRGEDVKKKTLPH